jgi:tRNA modification GTPase
MKTSTIAAISTPLGSGGIGIIKISGPAAIRIGGSIFKKSHNTSPKAISPREPINGFKSHVLYHGHIINDSRDGIIDEVLFVHMKGPHSYTGEDVVEIQAHSGKVVLTSIMDIVLKKGAVLAEPGEFTRRAFLNGRIDLTQAEAVSDLIQAKSISSLKVAASHLKGGLKHKILKIKQVILTILTTIEAAIDFPDDLEELVDPHKHQAMMEQEALEPLKQLVGQFESGNFLREGVSMVIVGRPNVGKSSLMNRLIDKDRAIVTAFPGTTRDTIEEYVNIEGIPVRITDTAGIQETTDPVEIIGIDKTKEQLSDAHLILFMAEAPKAFIKEDYEIIDTVSKEKLIFVVNKSDLVNNNIPQPSPIYRDVPCVVTSALHDKGIGELRKVIKNKVSLDFAYESDQTLVPNLRQKMALVEAQKIIEEVLPRIKDQLPAELMAIDLKECVDILGEVTGDTTKSDILDEIFKQFCIGK